MNKELSAKEPKYVTAKKIVPRGLKFAQQHINILSGNTVLTQEKRDGRGWVNLNQGVIKTNKLWSPRCACVGTVQRSVSEWTKDTWLKDKTRTNIMDGVDELEKGDPNINFVPCLKWIRRGMAQAQPEKVNYDISTAIHSPR